MKSSTACVLVILASLLNSGADKALATNLLANPGFETGDFTGWTVGGNSPETGVALDGTPIPFVDPPFAPAFVNVHSGSYAGFALVSNFHTHVGLTLSQTVAVTPGQDMSVGFWLGNDSQSAFGVLEGFTDIEISVNGQGVLPVGNENIDPGSTSADFFLFSASFNAGTSSSITVTFDIGGSGTATAGASFDDFFLTPVPEPSTLVLAALGSTGLVVAAARRRRCKS